MNPEDWQRVQSIFAQAADLPSDLQQPLVESLCEGDPRLLGSVLDLLREDAGRQPLLDGEAGAAMSQIAGEALQADHLRSLAQQKIGGYRLLRVLGEGGMGIVYLAERAGIGGLVAIKLLRDAWLSPMRRERFALEQQMLVQLNHPSIARLYDASTTEDGTPWFVMEYADGRPLVEYLRSRQASLVEDLTLFRQILEAVQYAHAHAIIHRDLKPSNILVTEEGQVKLLDFGIAKQMQPDPLHGDTTVAGLRMLTPGYAAPEQYTGAAVGVYTDIYALGVLLYEILTGQLPDPNIAGAGGLPTKPSVLARSAGPHAGKIDKQQWADLDALCLTALQPEPQRRYPSVDALQRDLLAFLEGRVLEARPRSVRYSLSRFIKRNRVALGSVAAALVLLVATAVLFTVRLARARDMALAEAERTKQIQHFLLDMLGNADQEAGPAQDLKVATLLDRAGRQAGALSSDPETQVELDQTIGSMYNRLGKYEQSEQVFSNALNTARRSAGAKSSAVASVLVQLGTLRGDRGNLKQAQKDVQDALDIAAANHLGANDETVIQAKIAMSRIDIQSGAYQKAIDLLTPLTQMDNGKESKAVSYDLRDSFSNLAVAEQEALHFDRAEAANRRAIELDRELLGESHMQTGNDLVNLASLELGQGNLPDAERLYREGVPIMQAWYGPDHPDVVTATSFLAVVLLREKKVAEAQAILLRVLPIQEKAFGPTHARVGFTLKTLGDCASALGDLPSAEADYRRAVDIDSSALGEASPQTAAVESSLGVLYLKESKNALAEQILRKADASLGTQAPTNVSAVVGARLGRALLALKRYPEAEAKLTSAHAVMKRKAAPEEYKTLCASLVSLYVATNQPEKARPYQTELADLKQ